MIIILQCRRKRWRRVLLANKVLTKWKRKQEEAEAEKQARRREWWRCSPSSRRGATGTPSCVFPFLIPCGYNFT